MTTLWRHVVWWNLENCCSSRTWESEPAGFYSHVSSSGRLVSLRFPCVSDLGYIPFWTSRVYHLKPVCVCQKDFLLLLKGGGSSVNQTPDQGLKQTRSVEPLSRTEGWRIYVVKWDDNITPPVLHHVTAARKAPHVTMATTDINGNVSVAGSFWALNNLSKYKRVCLSPPAFQFRRTIWEVQVINVPFVMSNALSGTSRAQRGGVWAANGHELGSELVWDSDWCSGDFEEDQLDPLRYVGPHQRTSFVLFAGWKPWAGSGPGVRSECGGHAEVLMSQQKVSCSCESMSYLLIFGLSSTDLVEFEVKSVSFCPPLG